MRGAIEMRRERGGVAIYTKGKGFDSHQTRLK
jgi:hypothetical protein